MEKSKRMKLGVIFGHGAGDCGAVSQFTTEADLIREYKPYLEAYFSNWEIDVVYFNSEINWYQYLQHNNFNFKSFDYIIEIHANSGVHDPNGNGHTTGFEVYVTNAESGISVETEMCLNFANVGLKNRGVKRTDFFVIRTIKAQGVSSALLELGFIGDKDDYIILESKKAQIAAAIGQPIIKYFNVPTKPQPPKPKYLYKVQCGAFAQRSNAEVLEKELEVKGFNAFIVKVEN